jgi:hypothetical protein
MGPWKTRIEGTGVDFLFNHPTLLQNQFDSGTYCPFDKFTIVANVKEPGQFKEIDFEPKSNTASCFADGLASLHLPPIKPCNCGSLPVVMDMSITP